MRIAVLSFVTIFAVVFKAALGFNGHGVRRHHRSCYYDDNHILCRWNTNHQRIGHFPLGADSDRDRARYERSRASEYLIRVVKPEETTEEKTKTPKALVVELEHDSGRKIRVIKPKGTTEEKTKTSKTLVVELEHGPNKKIRVVKPKETSEETAKKTKAIVVELEHEPSKRSRVVDPEETAEEKTKTAGSLVFVVNRHGNTVHVIKPKEPNERAKGFIIEA